MVTSSKVVIYNKRYADKTYNFKMGEYKLALLVCESITSRAEVQQQPQSYILIYYIYYTIYYTEQVK